MYGSTRIDLDSLTSVPTLAKGGRCILTCLRANANNSSPSTQQAYVQLFDAATAASVTTGTTVPDWIAAVVSSNISDGDGLPTMGIVFENGIVAAATNTPRGSLSATLNVTVAII